MADTGWVSPGTITTSSAVGTIDWTNPTNASASDNSFATVSESFTTKNTYYLKATNFGFSVPADNLIDGIEVRIEKKADSDDSSYLLDSQVKLVKSDGSIGTTNKADLTTHYPTTDTYIVYGGPSDNWSEGLLYGDVNDVDFGVVISSRLIVDHTVVVSIDHIQIKVYYSEIPTASVSPISFTLTPVAVTPTSLTELTASVSPIQLSITPFSYISLQEIETNVASSITNENAVLNGNNTDIGGLSLTERGFQINTVPSETTVPGSTVYEIGSFSAGAFSLTVNGLTPSQLYYFRAYSVSENGTAYGEWLSFIALPSEHLITINGIDRTPDIIFPSLVIDDAINDAVNTASLILDNRRELGFPDEDEEIVIKNKAGTTVFAGYITNVQIGQKMQLGEVAASLTCVDYTRLLDSNLVHRTYEAMTDKEIIEDIVSRYCAGLGITTNNVIEGVTIEQISFNYLQPSQCLRKLSELSGQNWYIDYDKDIHYFPLVTSTTPFNIDSSSALYRELNISKDSSQVKNRVYVRGGTKLSDFTTYTELGDGEKLKFVLPDKPHDVTVEINRSGGGFIEETVGIKNIDTTGSDWYLNFQEKYLEQDAGGAVLTTSDIFRITYKYDIPILVAVENTPSIIQHGQKEFAIFDKNIRTTQSARDRASAELTDYASSIIEGSFVTYESGFRSGQYININLTEFDINANYIVQQVNAESLGAGEFRYTISVASAKTMGIIKFLIELLESNKNIVELDDNEVIDELLSIADSLLTDSLTDSLTIDSAGPYATWCTDSLQSSPSTRAIWDLFQWG